MTGWQVTNLPPASHSQTLCTPCWRRRAYDCNKHKAIHIICILHIHIHQVGDSSRNNPSSNSINGCTCATEIGSNFIIRVRNTTDHWNLLIQSETAFSFHIWGNRSYVTIHLIGWFNFKTLWRVPCAKNLQENMKKYTNNTMQKRAYVATKSHAGAFRDECEPQKQFADYGSLLETWVNIFLFMI